MTYYTVYKITNILNGKYYIGKHKTKNLNDDYMGSGKRLKRAIKKHGIENFTKEILFVFDNEQEMNDKEKELVVVSEETYNLCEGGKGGFSYINKILPSSHRVSVAKKTNKILLEKYGVNCPGQLEQSKRAVSHSNIKRHKNGDLKRVDWLGKTHTEKTKKKISEANKISQLGMKNSQYGTCWITNGSENKKIKKEELDKWIELGYFKGRIYGPRV